MDRLPQERYLRVIADGMESYGVDQGYIQEEIMGVPYIPNRTPQKSFLQIPSLAKRGESCHILDRPTDMLSFDSQETFKYYAGSNL